MKMQEKITDIGWQQTVTEEINEKGYALVSRFLPAQYSDELIGKYDNSDLHRKTITTESFTLRTIPSSSKLIQANS
jgi:hypothetical protein